MPQDKEELLAVLKELFELLVNELAALNKRMENIEKEQALLRSLISSLLERENTQTSPSLTAKLKALFAGKKISTFDPYLLFLRENPEKIPISGYFKRSSLNKGSNS